MLQNKASVPLQKRECSNGAHERLLRGIAYEKSKGYINSQGKGTTFQYLSGRLHAAMTWADYVKETRIFKTWVSTQVDSLQDLRTQHSLASEELEKAKELFHMGPTAKSLIPGKGSMAGSSRGEMA